MLGLYGVHGQCPHNLFSILFVYVVGAKDMSASTSPEMCTFTLSFFTWAYKFQEPIVAMDSCPT